VLTASLVDRVWADRPPQRARETLLDQRTSIDELRTVAPELAARLDEIRRRLDR
jgi:hypothetical protein